MTKLTGSTDISPDDVRFVGATHPLKTDLVDLQLPSGLSILEMLEAAGADPIVMRDAVVFVDDWEIPRDHWHVVKPQPGRQVTARILAVPRGGGGGGGKNPLRTVLSIAVIAASFAFGPAVGGFLGISKTAGMGLGLGFGALQSAVGGAIISVAGNLLMNAIAPVKPPKLANVASSGAGVQDSPSLFLEGSRNQARPFDVIPSVLGYYRFKPPLGAITYSEVLGDANVLRMLMVPGIGELELSNWRIGNTPIEDYSDYELEVRNGTAGDADLTLHPDDVDQDEFSAKLVQADGWIQKTSALNADELSVDFAFPQGLVTFGSGGSRGSRTISIELEYREVGDVTWLPIPAGFESTFDSGDLSGSVITLTAARSVALRHSVRWDTPSRAQYEVQMRRTTLDNTSTSIFDDVYWGVLRTFTDEDPVTPPVPVAKAALRIRSTDQLSGIVDEVSVLAKSVVLDWNGSTWVEQASNNPASLFRHVLQGNAKAAPVTDDYIDITKLQEWHDFCVTNGFTFNQVRDYASSVWDTLTDICSAGRAGLVLDDGKWSVTIDQAQTDSVTHITPRNSFNFEAEKAFFDVPHAWRIRFPNENEDYNQDERIVYRDGYAAVASGGDVKATLFEILEAPGVTNPDHVWKFGRFNGALVTNSPERWNVNQDYEATIAKRGKKVRISHDVLLIGLASGRIKSLTTDGSGDVTHITVDEELTMESGKTYGLMVRRAVSGDTSLSVPITLDVGTVTKVTCNPAIAAANAPTVGDIFSFGEFGSETEEALVLSNEPGVDQSAKLTLIPYRDSTYTADTGTVPAFVTNITPVASIPTVNIASVTTDESVLQPGPGDITLIRARIEAYPVTDNQVSLEVQQRISGTGENYYPADSYPYGKHVTEVGGVLQGETYDFRARWVDGVRLPGAWTEHPNVTIVGKSTNPSALTGMTISVFGGQAYIRWDEPAQLDVKFGGTVQFRHSQSFASPSWAESVSIGDVAQARSLFAALPLKSGTYLARVFDADGNRSDSVTTVSSKQASVLQYANVSTIDEATAFAGTHTNTVGIDSQLKLDGSVLIDSVADWDSITDFDSAGGVELSGTYEFFNGFDFGSVKRVRLTTRVTSTCVNVNDLIDDRTTDIDTWEDFDGTDQAQADLQVWIRHTDDDPAGSPTWTEWERLDSAEFECRGVDAEARLSTTDSSINLICTELGIDAEEIV